MSWARRAALAGWLFLTLVSVPIQHCRSREVRALDPALVFPSAESRESSGDEPEAARNREAVPLADRLVMQLPRDPDPWRWAAADGVSLAVFSRRGEPRALVYAESMGSGPWSSFGLDRFLRTVAPALSSSALPFFASWNTDLLAGLEEEVGLEPAAVVELLGRLRSRTLGRGLGFRGHRTSFEGWRWGGSNRHGIDLQLGALDGSWGVQDEMPAPLGEVLGSLRLRGLVPDLSISERPSASSRERAARLVLGTLQRRPGMGVYVAVLHAAEPQADLAADLADLLDTVRLPRAGEMEALLTMRTPGDLERLARSLQLDLPIDPRRMTDEGWATLAAAFEEPEGESR